MRLPLVSPIESRDGTVEKDALCKNLLIEQDVDALAVLRPGLEFVADTTGNGNGIVDFNGEVLTVFGTALTIGDSFAALGTIGDSFYDFAQSTL